MKLLIPILLVLFADSLVALPLSHPAGSTVYADSVSDKLKITIPSKGRIKHNRPIGKNWVNLISSLGGWNADTKYWSLKEGVLHGEYGGGTLHNFSWTKKTYQNFELNVLIKMHGREANSGVCVRVQPVNADLAPGYQVDMGPGYWGSLWEEKRGGMVQLFPQYLVPKVVKQNDWNHYYIVAKDHHIQAWLNGVKTIDVVHPSGFTDGSIGFQLCHGNKETIIDIKTLYIREIK
ncbi:MAG: DUF1080 domain-containing protein [Pyrinomonadaceae bacterium]|nr:DUF1080 domain-containing protein [Sphingobacteriaceae bacterium]